MPSAVLPTRRVVLGVLTIGLLALTGAAMASSGSSVRAGSVYQGQFGGAGPQRGAVETFAVTGDGRHLASVTVFPIQCGVPPGPTATVRNVPIVKGSFTVAYPGLHFRSGFFGSAILRGHFSAHGRASGREDVRSNDTITGALCKYSQPWTARAEPTGTRQCPTHGLGVNLLVAGTTCAVADRALDKGKFVRPEPATPAGAFSTPGWKCRVVTGAIQNHQCRRSRPKRATFSFST